MCLWNKKGTKFGESLKICHPLPSQIEYIFFSSFFFMVKLFICCMSSWLFSSLQNWVSYSWSWFFRAEVWCSFWAAYEKVNKYRNFSFEDSTWVCCWLNFPCRNQTGFPVACLPNRFFSVKNKCSAAIFPFVNFSRWAHSFPWNIFFLVVYLI